MLSDLTQCNYCHRDFTYRIFRLARLLNIPRGIMVNLFVSKSLNKELYRMKDKNLFWILYLLYAIYICPDLAKHVYRNFTY